MLGMWKLAISLPLLLINSAVATDGQEVSQNVLDIADKWTLEGFTQVNCEGDPYKVSSSGEFDCNAIGEGSIKSYAFIGPQQWKVCLWGDNKCSDESYAASAPGDEIFQCRPVLFEEFAIDFTVISNGSNCVP